MARDLAESHSVMIKVQPVDLAVPALSKLLGPEHRLSRAASKRYERVMDRRGALINSGKASGP